MRTRGIFGYNLPPIVGNVVTPAAFGIAGFTGRFARGLVSTQITSKAFPVNNAVELEQICGGYVSGYYGRYALDSYFVNLNGKSGMAYVSMYVSASAVQAYYNSPDSQPTAVNTLALKAAWRTVDDKSADGNKTGYTLTNGARFTTTAASSALLSATSIVLTSVSGIVVGDLLKIVSGATTHYAKVSAKNESTKTLTVSALTNAITAADVVTAMGFQILTYRANANGIPQRVFLPEDKLWLSMESENTQYYVNNAFVNHPYLKLVDLLDPAAGHLRWPQDVSTVTMLASGSDGVAPVTADWTALNSNFDALPIRFLACTDSTASAVNIAGEAYCGARLDSPIWLYNEDSGSAVSDWTTSGQLYQRSNQVQGFFVKGWRNVFDPIGVGSNPVVKIPTNAAIIGMWIRAFYTYGFHRDPAGNDLPLLGFAPSGTTIFYEDSFTDDQLTQVVEAGVNVIQNKPGKGLIVTYPYTPSTQLGCLFAGDLLFQNFFKISAVESLADTINRPNRASALKEYGQAIRDFGVQLKERGSFPYGTDPKGPFGDFFKPDGTISTIDDVWQVQADQYNNTTTDIASGNGNITVRYYRAAPLTSLAIGVGAQLPSFQIPVG